MQLRPPDIHHHCPFSPPGLPWFWLCRVQSPNWLWHAQWDQWPPGLGWWRAPSPVCKVSVILLSAITKLGPWWGLGCKGVNETSRKLFYSQTVSWIESHNQKLGCLPGTTSFDSKDHVYMPIQNNVKTMCKNARRHFWHLLKYCEILLTPLTLLRWPHSQAQL